MYTHLEIAHLQIKFFARKMYVNFHGGHLLSPTGESGNNCLSSTCVFPYKRLMYMVTKPSEFNKVTVPKHLIVAYVKFED